MSTPNPEWCCEDCGKPWPLPGDPPIFAECDHCGGPLNAARPEENPDD